MDKGREKLLEEYVKGVVGHFKDDERVQVWDVWNEPDNTNGNSYGEGFKKQEPAGKVERSLELLKKSFDWTRAADPSQPVTSGVWIGDWSEGKASPTAKFQLEASDVVSFHSYDPPEEFKKRVEPLRRFKRPILCTEYMARPRGSRFDPILAYCKEHKIGAYNWGFVEGKTNTIYPWDSWERFEAGNPYTAEPPEWFHDIFRADGSAYKPEEVEYIRKVTGKK
jgi:hypothetical protein